MKEKEEERAKALYIPIWFYSNDKEADFISCVAFFTFQSGSIQIKYVLKI